MKTLFVSLFAATLGAFIAANVIASSELELRKDYTKGAVAVYAVKFEALKLKCSVSSGFQSGGNSEAQTLIDSARKELVEIDKAVVPAWRLWRLHQIEKMAERAVELVDC